MAPFPGSFVLAHFFIQKMPAPLSMSLLVWGHHWGDSIFPLIKRWHVQLSTLHLQCLAGGSLWHSTLVISAALWSQVPRTLKSAFPTEERCSRCLLPLCARAPTAPQAGAFMHPTPRRCTGGRAGYSLHMAATAVADSDLNFRII